MNSDRARLPSLTIDHPLISPEPNTGCWLWIGASANGYGMIMRSGHGRRRNASAGAHRLSYITAKGEIPRGLQVDHLCGVRCCVNPDHLEAVTCSENIKRAFKRNGPSTACRRGHPYTPESTLIYSNGYRACRICKAETMRLWRQGQSGVVP